MSSGTFDDTTFDPDTWDTGIIQPLVGIGDVLQWYVFFRGLDRPLAILTSPMYYGGGLLPQEEEEVQEMEAWYYARHPEELRQVCISD